MNYLTENQLVALELLAKYKYLTSSQFVRMGLYKKRAYLTNALKPLLDTKRALIAKHDFNPIQGKLESLYYLTKHGKNILLDEFEYSESNIKAPSGLSHIKLKDYHHRKLTIDFYIYLNQWLESNNGYIDFLNYYFDKIGTNRSDDKSRRVKALNRIDIDESQSFIPDINAIFYRNNNKYIILFEQHNGKDSKRLFEQLQTHIIAISECVVAKKYNNSHTSSHRVVVVCEEKSVKESVIQRLQSLDSIEYYYNFFIFKTNAELEDNFYDDWTLISGEQVGFLGNSAIHQ
jgi:hypothetical protein